MEVPSITDEEIIAFIKLCSEPFLFHILPPLDPSPAQKPKNEAKKRKENYFKMNIAFAYLPVLVSHLGNAFVWSSAKRCGVKRSPDGIFLWKRTTSHSFRAINIQARNYLFCASNRTDSWNAGEMTCKNRTQMQQMCVFMSPRVFRLRRNGQRTKTKEKYYRNCCFPFVFEMYCWSHLTDVKWLWWRVVSDRS